jgi:hypothetical protein
MAYLLEKIKKSLLKQNISVRTAESRVWLLTKIKNLSLTKNEIMGENSRLKDNTIVGKMYFYYYDPKTKDKLPYYDRFPLVLPVESYNDGFLGLNLHYINPKQRLILLDKLSEYKNNSKYDETTKLRLSYSLLKSSSKIYEKNACLKKYLFTHIKSKFLQINSDEWDIAVLLPLENFEKSTKNKVFLESESKF